jgi:gliding motility-associated-like protein
LQNCDDISFPSAFSPNADRLNDQFGALGNLFLVNNFSLTISNRFGEIVFYTNNPYQKWDGMYKGKPVSIGTFVWQVAYLYNNKLKKSKKGTLTLVR